MAETAGLGPGEDLSAVLREGIVRSRALDRCMRSLAQRGLLGIYPPAEGYEGHIYGALAGLGGSDWLFGDARMARAALARGMQIKPWLAQVLGLRGAANLGHGAPGELTNRGGRVVSTSSLMGTHLGHAMGVGHAMRLRQEDACVLAWFGPGAAASGDFHVALNFAGVYRTATLFYFCSSGNREADEQRLGSGAFLSRAKGYGIRGVQVDGSDPLAVSDCVRDAAVRARAGEGPTLIEGVTGGDPLDSLGGDLPELASRFEAEVYAAVEELLAAGPLPVEALFDEVWAESPVSLQQQKTNHLAHQARFGGGELD
ncbi:MAG: thiamine pyrophosphate-dependent enzyme [Myxococcota bacterium]|nr:thiamine pyrophosphate-dependent enzyme [Myxococcota bacterium]